MVKDKRWSFFSNTREREDPAVEESVGTTNVAIEKCGDDRGDPTHAATQRFSSTQPIVYQFMLIFTFQNSNRLSSGCSCGLTAAAVSHCCRRAAAAAHALRMTDPTAWHSKTWRKACLALSNLSLILQLFVQHGDVSRLVLYTAAVWQQPYTSRRPLLACAISRFPA